jgi:hypothetical protein
MMQWGPGEIIAAVVAVITLLGIICGGAWWMSALYTQLAHISRKLDEAVEDMKQTSQEFRATTQLHETRLTKLEIYHERSRHAQQGS